ncbi:MAG: T9SS type A sorting domain-containing protein, partial [Bacteroidota bacterium]
LVQLPTSNFTGALSCATVASCSQDNYEGTPVFWISNSKPNEFFYGADAYSGRDTVCMILCDALAICDTFVTPFMVTGDTLSLPFMDDFSYDGPYPDTSLWMESDVFVNNTMAMQPPSLGVATFDGLDATGTPRFGGIGRSDVLTSNYLDLTKDNANLFLSFYLQKQGLGDRPEVADNFIVEFKKADGTWQQITAIPGVADGVPLGTLFDFEFLSYPVDEQYLYDGFQFRFSAVNGRQGMLDLWHIDYIRLETNADISNVNDVAFALAPPSILEDYTAMPWNHFFANPASLLRTSNTTALFNHLGETTSVDDSRLLITENTTETVLNATTLRNALNVPAQVFTAFEYSFNTSQVSEQLVELSLNRPFDVTTAYELEREGQSSLVPILRNDRTQSTTRFDNYFAYDDGTAESNIIAQNFSSLAVQVAVEFEAYVGDSLQAVQFNIPRATADIEQQLFNINIWWDRDSLGGTPNQTLLGVSPVYVDNVVDSLQAFITYPLDEAVFIPAGKFWIGWQQATECSGSRCIPIGYDRNTTAANRFNYFNTSGENTPSEWVSFDSLSSIAPGALMIRPVMGNIKPIATDEVLDTETWNADEILVQIYPNPTRDVIQIALSDNDYSDFQIQLFNTAGQQLVSMPLVSQLDLSVFPTGMYFVEIVNRNTGQRVHHKVLRSAN